jgi:thioredoxin reductase (NADPH)
MSSKRKSFALSKSSNRTDRSSASTKHDEKVPSSTAPGEAAARQSEMAGGNYVRYIDAAAASDHVSHSPGASDSTKSSNYVSYLQPEQAVDEERISSTHISIAQRRPQMFPCLSGARVKRAQRFGTTERWSAGEMMFRAGEPSRGLRIILSGTAVLNRRDGLGESHFWAELGKGQFIGETGQLTGRPHLVDGYAAKDTAVLLISPERIRALLVEEAGLGEQIMRALILRRVGLIQEGCGPVLIGLPGDAKVTALEGFFRRVNHPYRLGDVSADADVVLLLSNLPEWRQSSPIVVLVDGTILHDPKEAALAASLGLLPDFSSSSVYDVAVVGAGPSGLATAVYAASEGLTVVVFDTRGPGGQAIASARIENYLGFPTGISGHALAHRAYMQAVKFGAEIAFPAGVAALDCKKSPFEIELESGRQVSARTVVIATGAAYRQPDIRGLNFVNTRGVYYWASPIEGRLCQGEDVVLMGGGNSAGQAVVFLANFARRVNVIVRKNSLKHGMSRYLVDRVMALPNVKLYVDTEVESACTDDDGLCGVSLRSSDRAEYIETRHLFLFIGAVPNTRWLRGCGVKVDDRGFVATGRPSAPDAAMRCLPLETSVPGVFAIGDVRSKSTKRVAAAVGEGAAVVAEVHSLLSHAETERLRSLTIPNS